MDDEVTLENFTFESREDYDRAEKELRFIERLRENMDLTSGMNAQKVYERAVADKMFRTVVGYLFLNELRQIILESGVAEPDSLADIPVPVTQNSGRDVMTERSLAEQRSMRLYEGQRTLNQKLKIVIVALTVLLLGFVIINFRFEYSIFTYFTNYKANMEEELIDKYENWQSDLEERERALEENGGNHGGEYDTGSGRRTEDAQTGEGLSD